MRARLGTAGPKAVRVYRMQAMFLGYLHSVSGGCRNRKVSCYEREHVFVRSRSYRAQPLMSSPGSAGNGSFSLHPSMSSSSSSSGPSPASESYLSISDSRK